MDIQKLGVILLDELRSIPVHQECVLMATANVCAEYTGTMSLDRALVGRFSRWNLTIYLWSVRYKF